jgi:hypothetical protein
VCSAATIADHAGVLLLTYIVAGIVFVVFRRSAAPEHAALRLLFPLHELLTWFFVNFQTLAGGRLVGLARDTLAFLILLYLFFMFSQR